MHINIKYIGYKLRRKRGLIMREYRYIRKQKYRKKDIEKNRIIMAIN